MTDTAATTETVYVPPVLGNTNAGGSVAVVPTQMRRPWRSTVRTVFQALLALCVLAPVVAATAGLDAEALPFLAGFLAVAAGITRVMALPGVEVFLRTYLPFLAAAPKQ